MEESPAEDSFELKQLKRMHLAPMIGVHVLEQQSGFVVALR